MISMIGSRSQTGALRWTFDWLYLWDGVPLVPATLGVFALPELAELAVLRQRIAGDNSPNIHMSSQWVGVKDALKHWWLVLRCGALGTGLGAIPGLGSAVIDWIAYGYAQRTEKNSETFGTGDVRGVIAPESSNNAKEGGHLVPTIAFGVPAGASMAILLGAFLMHGLTPGPEMLTKHLDVTYTIVWSLTLAHVIGAIICLTCSRYLAMIARVPPQILLPIIVALVFIASFEGQHDWGDLYSLFFFGVVGWIMKRLGWPRPPLVLGLVIGGIFERYLFISTELYGWAWVLRPVVLAILACVVWALYRPMSQIVRDIAHELRDIKHHKFRLTASASFTIVVMAVIAAAVISGHDWPPQAKVVPFTAAGLALSAAGLNLVNELFGKQTLIAIGGSADSGSAAGTGGLEHGLTPATVRWRATLFFGWIAFLFALVYVIGFIPAIGLFVFLYMWLGFGEPWYEGLGYAVATTALCWGVFDWALLVPWPQAWLGEWFPELRSATGLF
jgi:hypothetical protein